LATWLETDQPGRSQEASAGVQHVRFFGIAKTTFVSVVPANECDVCKFKSQSV
jgi:hypothetical protein